METVWTVLSAVRENDFMLMVDLMDAYFQVPVHLSSCWYPRFVLNGVVYQFKVLCSGLSTAPQVFMRVFTLISVWVHSHGIRLLRYLDDWLILASSRLQLLQDRDHLLGLCHELGVVINFWKSDLTPKQRTQYLGMLIDKAASRVLPSKAQISTFRKVARQFLSQQDQPAQQWQVVIGHLSSLEKLVPHRQLHLQSLQWGLRDFWDQSREPQSVLVPISQEVRDDLAWWLDDRNLCIGTPLSSRPPDLLLFSDASKEGWGAHPEELLISGMWNQHNWHLHINVLEIKAAFLGLQCFQDRLMGHLVALMSDNTTMVAYVNKQGGLVSRALHELMLQVHQWAVAHSVELLARYIPGKRNVLADTLSRQDQVVGSEWSLHQSKADKLFNLWGRPVVDLFATQYNRKLPTFFSVILDPWAAAEDAFQHSWDNLEVYAFPPFCLLRPVLSRVLVSMNLHMILVAPKRPEAT
ncbi:uncharacterized protein [Macrobrachium rosenbergii]|uniref:uncharacterized protein n=1 Tax=Macrobrachium rosenbergii TaxID=79674 RepID=UPI0034D74868